MKKLSFLGLSLLILLSVHAQTKITNTSVLGKWVLSEVEMTGMFYYNVEKDSLALGNMVKAQAKDEQQLSAAIAMIKPQLAMLSKMSFAFNADGTAMLNPGMGDPKPAIYRVDEENSTITTIEKDSNKEDSQKADMLKDQLRIFLKQPQGEGEIMMILKKAKS